MPIFFKHDKKFHYSEKADRISWFKGLFSGEIEKYRNQRELDLTKYWIAEIENSGNIKSVGLDYSKRPLVRTKNLLKEYPDSDSVQNIGTELFEDIYEMVGLRDWDNLVKITSKYLGLWTKESNPNAPEFPVLLIEENGTYMYFLNSEELTRIDVVQYPWDGGEYLVDRNLNQYETEYWNFGHPIGVVIPRKIKLKWTREELLKILQNEPPEWLK